MIAMAETPRLPAWLAIDVGNSRVKFGIFTEPGDHRLPGVIACVTAPLRDVLPWDQTLEALGGQQVACAIAGSNQDGVRRCLREWPDMLVRPTVFEDSTRFPVEIDVEFPRRVGLDRLLAAVAANVIRDESKEAIIVDCGTATTVDRVNSYGVFTGGAILPGFELSATALHHYTEVLPLIPIEAIVAVDPESGGHEPLGRNTEGAMMSGIFWGQVGAIRELVARIGRADTQLLLAGGGSRLLVPHFPQAAYYPQLALQGLVMAASGCR